MSVNSVFTFQIRPPLSGFFVFDHDDNGIVFDFGVTELVVFLYST